MYQFFIFIRDSVADITDMLGSYSFSIGGISVSLFDLILGFIAMSIIIAVFWKGARA